MDYEKPVVPPSWEAYAAAWIAKLGLTGKEVRLICSPNRYGMPIILRLARGGQKVPYTRRSSDAPDAAERRARFIEMARSGNFDAIEIDFAGFFVEEALVAPKGSPAQTQWQPAIVTQLVRVSDPDPEVQGEGEAADHHEDDLRAQKVEKLRASPDAPKL